MIHALIGEAASMVTHGLWVVAAVAFGALALVVFAASLLALPLVLVVTLEKCRHLIHTAPAPGVWAPALLRHLRSRLRAARPVVVDWLVRNKI